MLAPQKESIFGRSCRLWLLSWRRARVFARSCSLLSKYLPISWKQRKEQSHAQCHVTHRIRIFDKISEHVKVAKSVDIAVPELAVTFLFMSRCMVWTLSKLALLNHEGNHLSKLNFCVHFALKLSHQFNLGFSMHSRHLEPNFCS